MVEHQNGHNFVVVGDDAFFISNSQSLPVLRDNLSLTLTIPGAVLSHTIAKSSRIQGRAKRAPYIFFRIQPTATAASAASRHTAQAVERKKISVVVELRSINPTTRTRTKTTTTELNTVVGDGVHSSSLRYLGILSHRPLRALLSAI